MPGRNLGSWNQRLIWVEFGRTQEVTIETPLH